jgi:hypothetical protein
MDVVPWCSAHCDVMGPCPAVCSYGTSAAVAVALEPVRTNQQQQCRVAELQDTGYGTLRPSLDVSTNGQYGTARSMWRKGRDAAAVSGTPCPALPAALATRLLGYARRRAPHL